MSVKITAGQLKTVTRAEIVGIINNAKKGSMVGLTYSTKTGSRNLVKKVTETTVLIGKNYQDFINKALERQGEVAPEFVAKEKKGFDRVHGTDRFIRGTKNGELALKFIVAKNIKPKSRFFFGEREITKEGNPNLFTPSQLKTYAPTIGRGEVKADDKGQMPRFQNVYLSNIKRVTLDKVVYVLID